ncbi:DUF2599 domain-containing protein [Jongsikchunia kroppenstedtii]|uniref:DUF2599 domain-containing protein n=1 Tax=Jongsikchunia kroppenstedtii TaxID=1121721 RepID=UPI00036EA879|nr:DUF2599 domain-containing protein [Jongsikchunia kroppenstedtii]
MLRTGIRGLAVLLSAGALAFGVAGCGDSGGGHGQDDTVGSTTAPTTSAQQQTPSETAAPSYAGPTDPPGVAAPFIDHVQWVQTPQGPSLQVVPTPNGRVAQASADMGEAWGEVVKKDPKADTPGMQAQFDCHWRFARIVQPNKPSWNLEPWRPVVTDDEMMMSQCNPGGPEI